MIDKVAKRTLVEQPTYEEGAYSDFILWLASIADDIQPWGGSMAMFRRRDAQLRQFWQLEPILASAIYTIAIRDASYSWTLSGDAPRTIQATQDMLHNSDLGSGWLDFIVKWKTDFLTQDNGSFFEIIRQTDSPDSVVIGINHLDAGRCRRTGVPEWPVIYSDRKGREHKILPHQIVYTSDMTSPIETVNGMGFCAVSRVLRQAQFMRDIGIRDRERASGIDPKTLHLVSGISKQEIQNVLAVHKEGQIEQGYIRYAKPAILSTIDPTKAVSTTAIDLAPRPDQWDEDIVMKWYITLLAMALGCDYQDLAPLPSKGIGGSQQSLILHQKSKGKGPEFFMKTIEQLFNFHGVVPQNVTFEYDEKDIADELEQADLLKSYADTHKIFIDTGVLTPQASRNILLDDGLISQEIFDMLSMGTPDATEEVTAPDDERLANETTGIAPVESEEFKQAQTSQFDRRERLAWEKQMDADMVKAFNKMYKEIKRRLLPAKAIELRRTKQTPENLMGDERFWKEYELTMRQAMNPNVRQIFLGVANYNAGLGLAVNFDLINVAVLEYSRTYTTEWVENLTAETQKGMRQAIVNWQESGLGKRGMPDLVDSMKPFFDGPRAARVAKTETNRVFDQGNKASHKSAGIEYEQWQTSNDDHVRPSHADLQGEVFPIDEGPRPSDWEYNGETGFCVNCRCARVPISTAEAERLLGV